MATAVLSHVSVEQYLRSEYEPDADYIDGRIEERPMGEWEHSKLQKLIMLALAAFERKGEFLVAVEQRVQVSPTRFRVPDVCLIRAEDEPDRIVSIAPRLCIEILSPADTSLSVHERSQDYLGMGVPEVWIFDPATVTVNILQRDRTTEQHGGVLPLAGTSITLDLDQLDAEMVRRKR